MQSMRFDLLLISNSVKHGQGYLEHARLAIREFMGGERDVLFVLYAMADYVAYTAHVASALEPLGLRLRSLHLESNQKASVESASLLYVGGGNSFRLLQALQANDLLEPVRRRVSAGELRYMGASAGANMACPTLRTTNDMPIVEPTSFESFDLVPFQINPHYQDPDPASTHMGETREVRIAQFLEENDVLVAGTTPVHEVRGVQPLAPQQRPFRAGVGQALVLVQNRELVRGTEPTPRRLRRRVIVTHRALIGVHAHGCRRHGHRSSSSCLAPV